jgi:hypothetical protein
MPFAFNSRTTRIASSAPTPAMNLEAARHEKLQFVTSLCAQPALDRWMKNERSIDPSSDDFVWLTNFLFARSVQSKQ